MYLSVRMEYNVTSFCVHYMGETSRGLETIAAFKYDKAPNMPDRGMEFRLIRNGQAARYKVAEFLGMAYSIDGETCMQSYTYLVKMLV